jgi:hypothetical protein
MLEDGYEECKKCRRTLHLMLKAYEYVDDAVDVLSEFCCLS